MLKDSSKFLTGAINIRNADEGFFVTFKLVSGFMMGVSDFFSGSLIIQSG